jgi:uncharacterized membrane protein YccC
MPSAAEPSAAAVANLLPESPLARATRIAVAAVLSLFVSELFHLTYSNLAVWTTHLIMVKYDHTVFQKGIERIVGRFLGIFVGWALLAVFKDAWGLRLCFEAILVTALFYLYFAQRLAYTFLNAGILTVTIIGIGDQDPTLAYVAGREILAAVAIGILAANLVMWSTYGELDLSIQTGLEPLLPLRLDWLNHSAMLTASALVAVLLSGALILPTPQSIISVLVIGIAPDIQQGLRKGELRLLGAVLALAWGALTFVLVGRLPYFLVFTGMLFFGMLLAAYLTRASDAFSYAGLQMGLVLPLLVVVPLHELGDVESVVARLEGVVAALVSTLVIGSIWPLVFRTAEPTASHK